MMPTKKLGKLAPKLPSRGKSVSAKKFINTTMNQQQATAAKINKGVKYTN